MNISDSRHLPCEVACLSNKNHYKFARNPLTSSLKRLQDRKQASHKLTLSNIEAVSDRISKVSLDENSTRVKVIPNDLRKEIIGKSFDEVIKCGFLIGGRQVPTIKLSLTPKKVRLDSRSSRLTNMFLFR